MTARTLAILAALALVLGALLAVDVALEEDVPVIDIHVLPGLDPGAIETLELGEVTVERRERGWWITRPVDAPANPDRVEDLLEGLRLLSWRGELADPDAAALAARGLGPDAPRLVVTGAGQTAELRFGREEGALEQIWVAAWRPPQPWRAYLVDRGLARPLTPTVEELRSRRLVVVPPGDFRRLAIGELVVEVADGQPCVHTTGGCLPADPRRIEAYLALLGDTRFVEFLEGDLQPVLVVELVTTDGKTELALGGPCPASPSARLARSEAGTGCLAAADAHAIEAGTDSGYWIDRRLAPVDPATVDRIEIEDGRARISLVREGSAWRREDGEPVDADAVREYLDAVTSFELPVVTARPAATGPRITLGSGAARLTVHRPAGGAGRELFDPSPLRFLDRRVLAFDPHAVTAFERDGQRWQRGEALGDWTPALPPDALSMIATAASLRGARAVALAPARAHGLSAPRATLHFDVAPSPTEPDAAPRRHSLVIGAATDTGCYARRGEGGPVFELTVTACEALLGFAIP